MQARLQFLVPIQHSDSIVSRRAAQLAKCALLVLGSTLCASAFAAASPAVEARYQKERAACESGQSAEDSATCLREAAAARAAAAQGQLEEPQNDYERNALARCKALPPADREACQRRMHGEGVTRGSVAGGGIYREYREIILPKATPADGATGSSTVDAAQSGHSGQREQRQPTK